MKDSAKVDFADIQGLVRFAHAQLSETAYLMLKVRDASAARIWLLNAPITSSESVTPKPESAMQVALSAKGLYALQVEQAIINEFSDEFIGGMVDADNRSRRLGDIGANDPSHWQWGGLDEREPDVLLMVFAKQNQLAALLEDIQSDEFNQAFAVTNMLRSEQLSKTEPFGFVDGISQPKTDWQQEASADLHERDHFSNLMALGEVLLGYRNEYGLYTDRPLIDKAAGSNVESLPAAEDQPNLHDLGKNGSYLVFRQLSQNVPEFWQTIDRAVGANSERREQLASQLVGRQRDGTPLAEKASETIQGILVNSDNQFHYANDPHGQTCPLGAHVRRANPRTGDYPKGVTGFWTRIVRVFGFKRAHPHDDLISSTRFHRILRRGRPYGAQIKPEQALKVDKNTDNVERGLHFICLGANISRQFEFIQNAWLMNTKFAGLSTEQDPLLGNREPQPNGTNVAEFTIPQQSAPAKCIDNLPQFVTVRGGGYFFMPGLAALQFIVSDKNTTEQ